MFSGKRFVLFLLGAVMLAGLAAGLSGGIIRYAGPVEVVRVENLSGTDYESISRHATISAALNSITDNDSTHRYLVRVPPGTFDEQVTMKPYVDVEGSGQNVTTIAYTGGGTINGGATVTGANNAELRDLTVESDGTGQTYATGIYDNGASPALTRLTISASGGSSENNGVYNTAASNPTMTDVTVNTSGGTYTRGIYNISSSPTLNHVTTAASGGTYSFGLHNTSSSPTLKDVTASGNGAATSNTGVYNASSSFDMTDVIASASGGVNAIAVHNKTGSSPVMVNVTASATGSSANSTAIRIDNSSEPTLTNVIATASGASGSYGMVVTDDAAGTTETIVIRQSSIVGGTNAIASYDTDYVFDIGSAELDGVVTTWNGNWTCANSTDGHTNQRDADCIVRTLRVAPNSHYPTITSALNAIGATPDLPAASASLRYTVLVGPGTYTEQVTMEPYVDIAGAGQSLTTIAYTGSNSPPAIDGSSATIIGATDAALRDVTVESDGTGKSYAIGVFADGTSPLVTRVSVSVGGAGDANYGTYNDGGQGELTDVTINSADGASCFGIYNSNASPAITDVSASASGGNSSYAIRNHLASAPVMTNVTATGTGVTYSYGVYNSSNTNPVIMTNVTAGGSGGTSANYAVVNVSASPEMTNITATASGGSTSAGVHNTNGSPDMHGVTATATNGTAYNIGVLNEASSSPTMTDVTASASGGTNNYGVANDSSSPTMNTVNASATGGTFSRGVSNTAASPVMNDVTASASAATAINFGVYNDTASNLTLTDSTVTATGGPLSYGVAFLGSSVGTLTDVTVTASDGSTSSRALYIEDDADSASFTVRIYHSRLVSVAALAASGYAIYNVDANYTLRIGGTFIAADGGYLNLGTAYCPYDWNELWSAASCPTSSPLLPPGDGGPSEPPTLPAPPDGDAALPEADAPLPSPGE